MLTFCTIITHSHLAYATVLYNSLLRFNSNIDFNIFIADRDSIESIDTPANLKYYGCQHLCVNHIANKIKDKYRNEFIDEFRWSMKPVFIKYLLVEKKYDKVIFIDPDTYFFNDYNFLFDDLDKYDVLLTPHWRGPDPYIVPKNFHFSLTQGIFNGGFVGANVNGTHAMDWWAMVCEYACEKNSMKGLYVDQKYLDLLPIYFDNIGIMKHRGCNVAFWNLNDCKREKQPDETVLIDGKYPIIFIHFSYGTINAILKGLDPYLFPYLQEYADALNKHDFKLDIISSHREIITKRSTTRESIIASLKHKVKKVIGYSDERK
jgi:hypothetical protein